LPDFFSELGSVEIAGSSTDGLLGSLKKAMTSMRYDPHPQTINHPGAVTKFTGAPKSCTIFLYKCAH